MKLDIFKPHSEDKLSLPVRGAWIEILLSVQPGSMPASLPVRGAWIEIFL